jgi:Xaa-Pro aminopeptidase
LKGVIALAKIVFPPNMVRGPALDAIARQFLWQHGLDYRHGTGHGVGSFLNVHEGPQSIAPANMTKSSTVIPSSLKVPLAEGMIVSNEPGFYKVMIMIMMMMMIFLGWRVWYSY